MASLGRLREVVLDTSGNAISSAAVEVRRQGATVVSGSGTSPITITVNNPGGIVAGDTVVINTGTTEYTVDSVTATTVVLSGFLLTLTLSDEDRISPTNNLVTLQNDAEAGETIANPLTTDSTGTVNCWVIGNNYDLHISGSGVTTTLVEDRRIEGDSMSTNHFDTDGSIVRLWDTERTLTSVAAASARLVQYNDNGVGQLKFGSDTDGNPAGNVHRFGEAALWAAGADNAPFKTWANNDQALVFFRVHLENGGSNEQYNFSTRTNFRGDSTGPQVGVIHETQWHGVDGDDMSVMYGFQSVARDSGTTAGGTNPIVGLMAAVRGDIKLTPTTGASVITDAAGLMGAGPNSVGSYTGTITRGSACLLRTGDEAQTNYALQIEQGGGIVMLSGQNSGGTAWTIANNPAITNTLIHNGWFTEFTGSLTSAGGETALEFRYLNLEPTIKFTLGSGGGFNTVSFSGLHVAPTINTADTVPMLQGIRITTRNTGAGVVTNMYGLDVTAPTNSGGGSITTQAGIRIAAPDTALATNAFHMRLTSLITATPKTDLDAMSASNGDMIFVTDSNNADNSGLCMFMNGAWYAWTPGGVAAISDT